jgi:hypothetical protein
LLICFAGIDLSLHQRQFLLFALQAFLSRKRIAELFQIALSELDGPAGILARIQA